jgi:hypothetical protein
MSPLPVDLGNGVVLRRYELRDLVGRHRIEIRGSREREESRGPRTTPVHYEGIEREGSRGSRGFYDLAVYSLLDREWRHSPISTDR